MCVSLDYLSSLRQWWLHWIMFYYVLRGLSATGDPCHMLQTSSFLSFAVNGQNVLGSNRCISEDLLKNPNPNIQLNSTQKGICVAWQSKSKIYLQSIPYTTYYYSLSFSSQWETHTSTILSTLSPS